MKLPISWLKEYVDIGDITPKQLSDKLLSIGFEVEEIISPREDITGVVAGKVTSIERHENSDKLWNLIFLISLTKRKKKSFPPVEMLSIFQSARLILRLIHMSCRQLPKPAPILRTIGMQWRIRLRWFPPYKIGMHGDMACHFRRHS